MAMMLHIRALDLTVIPTPAVETWKNLFLSSSNFIKFSSHSNTVREKKNCNCVVGNIACARNYAGLKNLVAKK